MTRTPLRPLARVLEARRKGRNPDAIENENRRLRKENTQAQTQARAQSRLLVLGIVFLVAFVSIGVRMSALAGSEPVELPQVRAGNGINTTRADIVDRHGNILASNFEVHALYAHPHQMVNPQGAAQALAGLFPDLDYEKLFKDFTGKRKFLWVKKRISADEMQKIHEIGEPGLLFAPRKTRLYPNGPVAAHVLGGATFGKEGVAAAELIGVAGVEKYFDDRLRDSDKVGTPLQLSLDLSVQAASERVLWGGMKLMNAKGAASVLMDVHTGEVLSVVSLPDFDPNNRPRPALKGDPSESPLFNRAVQGVYELGSVFKIFTVAQAVETGLVSPFSVIDTKGPFRVGRKLIEEFNGKNYGKLSVTDVIVKSSNRGTGRLALKIGSQRQQAFLKSLGFFDPTPFEMVEASGGKPLLPKNWTDLSTVTISYGHGLSVSPLHLAAGYAAIANGGYAVSPTLLKQSGPAYGPRVMSAETSRVARGMLRKVVTKGTATSFGEVKGYAVGGKTGTADKPKPTGGYYDEKVIATFACLFPAHDPKYVLIVTLDEPVDASGEKPRRTAGWTAVPVASQMIRRIAPLLGMPPSVEPVTLADITRSR